MLILNNQRFIKSHEVPNRRISVHEIHCGKYVGELEDFKDSIPCDLCPRTAYKQTIYPTTSEVVGDTSCDLLHKVVLTREADYSCVCQEEKLTQYIERCQRGFNQ